MRRGVDPVNTTSTGPHSMGIRKESTVNFLQIIQKILAIAPAGIQLTQEVVALVQAIEAAFGAGQTPAAHQEAVVSALGAHLATAQKG